MLTHQWARMIVHVQLWDDEIREVLPQIDELSAGQRFELSIRAIKHTVTFDEEYPTRLEEATADFLLRSLVQADEALVAGRTWVSVPDGLEEEAHAVLDAEEAEGAEPLVMAVLNVCGLPESGMEAGHVVDLLSSCYQSILERQGFDADTPESERANPDCVRAIQEQKDLVRSFSA